MASEAILRELFQVAKVSVAFKGISEAEVWKACLAYKERPDEHIQIAIDNIRKRDQEAANKALESQQKLERGKEKMIALHQKEANDRQNDTKNAEKILAGLFNK